MDADVSLNCASIGDASARPVPARRRALEWRSPISTAKRLAGWWCLALVLSAPVSTTSAFSGTWRMNADESVVGRAAVYVARHEDTLLDIARRFRLGIAELRLANPGADIWLPGAGTPVTLVHQGVKAGWAGNELYVEVHPSTGVADEEGRPGMTEAVRALIAATSSGGLPPTLDWNRVEEALATANGIPVAVARRPAGLAASAGNIAR